MLRDISSNTPSPKFTLLVSLISLVIICEIIALIIIAIENIGGNTSIPYVILPMIIAVIAISMGCCFIFIAKGKVPKNSKIARIIGIVGIIGGLLLLYMVGRQV